jgi:hypothetical protein
MNSCDDNIQKLIATIIPASPFSRRFSGNGKTDSVVSEANVGVRRSRTLCRNPPARHPDTLE